MLLSQRTQEFMSQYLLFPLAKTCRFEASLALGAVLVMDTVHGTQPQRLADTLKRQTLSKIVVTATGSATKRSRVPPQVQVLTRAAPSSTWASGVATLA